MSDPSQYLNKSVQVICADKRVVYGVLSCISSPFSIILQHSVATNPSPLELDLEFHYNPQFPAKYFTTDDSLREAYQNYQKANNDQKEELQKKVDEAKAFNDEFMKDKYYIGSVVIPGEQIEKQSETCLNYDFITAPFTPNTFSLWRDVNFPYLDSSQMFQFVKQIDQELFQTFLEKVREAYAKKLTYEDLKLDLKYDIEAKKLKQIFEADLKKQVDTICIHMSYYQAQIEYAYDLLRRIHIYKFVEYTEKEIDPRSVKDSTLYQKYLDKIMKGLITNVQEIATEKIKDFCATGLIKSNSFVESGKSFIKQFLFSGGAAVSKITNFNIGLFIGGLIAEQIVSKVALSIMINRVSAKLDLLHLEIDQMTNELTFINSELDHLIYKAAEEYPKNLEEHKSCNLSTLFQVISAFVQKNYRVNVGSDYIYSAETNTIISTNVYDDCVIISEQDYEPRQQQQLSEEVEGESFIIKLTSNLNNDIKMDHF